MANLDAPSLSGVYQGLLAVRTGRDVHLRVQLFPDLGSKFLDLSVTPSGIEGRMGDEKLSLELPAGNDADEAPEASLPFLFAVTLQEHFTALDPERVIGVRSLWGNWQLRLAPQGFGVEVTVVLDEELRILERRYRYRGARWRELPGEPLRIAAWGVELTLATTEEDVVAELPDGLFLVPPSNAGSAP